MFPAAYFAPVYFAPDYFCKVGGIIVPSTGVTAWKARDPGNLWKGRDPGRNWKGLPCL